jgi:hypothetical protein
MLCSNCGAPIEHGKKECQSCGSEVKKEKSTKNQILQTTSSGWLKLLVGIVILGLLAIGYNWFYNSAGLSDIAQNQLKALRHGDLASAYYQYTSKSYQSKHSLDSFKSFIENNPSLGDNQSARFYEHHIDDQLATLTGTLIARNNTSTPVIYRFIFENGKWKILNIQILESGVLHTNNSRNEIALADHSNTSQDGTTVESRQQLTEELIKPIQAHLNALRSNDIDRAYTQYVSKAFQQATPLQAFRDFIKTHPIISNYKTVQFGDAKLENGQGRILATLVSDSGNTSIEYILIKEDNKWKIWGMRVLILTPSKESALAQATPSNATTPVSPSLADQKQNIINVIQRHLDALKANDISKAYNETTSKEFMEATSLDNYRAFVKSYPELTGYRNVKFQGPVSEGNLQVVKATLSTDKGESEIDFRIVRDSNNQWKIWGVNIIHSVNYPAVSQQEKQELIQIITAQLDALRQKDISQAYYAFTSKEFKKATSQEAFADFIKSYPIFISDVKITPGDGFIEGNLRLIRITLSNEKESVEVDYRLTKEGNQWKIWGIQIYTTPESQTPHNQGELLTLVRDQLDALRANDISKAYYAFTSQEFQDSASREDFKKFVEAHSALIKNQNLSLKSSSFDQQNKATAIIDLTSTDGSMTTFEYRFVYEDQIWKILSIQKMGEGESKGSSLNSNQFTETKSNKPFEFSKAVLGTKVDLKGMVLNPTTTFKTDKSDITVNLFVENGVKGNDVEVTLKHLDSNSSINPIKVILDKDGDSVVNVIYSPPTQGWPEGSYKLTAKSSTGATKDFDFKVEK